MQLAPDGALIAGTRSEQTFTVYDYPENNTISVALPTAPTNLTLAGVLATAGISSTNYTQNNLSGNVAITYTKPGATISAITWYSYDLYGRAEWIVQYNEGIGAKTIHYQYDYKGNVKKVLFQKDKTAELFAHQYTYNANDVLTKVETSTDNTSFTTHADNSYYLTGELKRVNIAQGTQGLDYVYTLGGQLKSINHPSLEVGKDPGGDSNDVFGLTLDYYNGDYLRTGRNIISSPTIGADYNGNIKAARWANKGTSMDLSGSTINQKGYLYTYDRNNWITGAAFGNTNSSTAEITATTSYKEAGLSYDANGNIITLQRTNFTGTMQDDLSYTYNTNKNQLNSVADAAGASTGVNDIGTQTVGNYQYDAIGQMTRNNLENIDYTYNTQGLVTQVNKAGRPVVKFYYNERGQRIKKESYNTASPYTLINTDYYILDLSGNVMAIYNQPNGSGAIVQKDLPIFGLSRLGVCNRTAGTSTYKITDHLGNVRAVVQKNTSTGTTDIKSYADYYPFGEQLPNRNSNSGNYRYAFQGQELDTETNMEAFQLRLWDGRIGRWLSTDPAGQYSSPYLGMGNNPINGIDPNGGVYQPYLGPSTSEVKHFGIGVWNSVKSLGSAIWYLGDTIDAAANFAELGLASSGIFGGIAGGMPGSHIVNTLLYDQKFGTNTTGTLNNFNASLDNFYSNISSDNANVRAEAFGGVVGSIYGAKGLGAVTRVSVTYVPIVAEAGVGGEILALQSAQRQLLLGQTARVVAEYNIQFAVSQGLESGGYNFNKIRSMIPNSTPNTFNPSYGGEKYIFGINGTNVQLKWHTPEFAGNVPIGSNANLFNTAQIKVGNRYLQQFGGFIRNNRTNQTHIPLNE